MAFELQVDIVDPGDGSIKVRHSFFGLTEKEVEAYKTEHLAGCEYYRAAEADDRTIEELFELDEDELPEAETEETEGADGEDGNETGA